MTATAASPAVPAVPAGLLGHVDDPTSLTAVLETLGALHGASYRFAVRRWDGEMQVTAPPGRTTHWFVVRAVAASARGAAVWPGDTLTVSGGDAPLLLEGSGVAFEVSVAATAYRVPAVVHLRDLIDYPRGCAAYEGAFRRQALPPMAPSDPQDRRGENRVNQHTLDMRPDRTPGPTTHYHSPVPIDAGQVVSHSETAIVLPRAAYGLPETTEPLRAVLYRSPEEDSSDTVAVPLREGSILVTPASERRGGRMGHRFENAFAMLIAIPGFVSETTYLP